MSLLRSRNCLSSRRHRLLLPLVLLAAAATLWALYETPYDGPWIGTTSESRAVSFTVSNGGSEWSSFLYTIAFFCPAVGGTVTTGITTSGPGTITDGEINYSGPNGVAFTGAFDTPTTASGTFTLTDYPVTHGLPYPPYIHTDIIDHSGTWTATFDGAVNVLVVTSPNGGETWAAGSHHDITWSSVGEIADVKLEYSTNGGTDWTIIVETTPNSESYPWTLPGSPSPSCLVRISDASVPSVFDASNAVFSIVPTIPALERQALIAIYNATAGDSWNNSYGWKTPPLDPDGFAMPGTEGNWAGMTVDVANSTVVQLNLIYNNLAGSIPPEIGDLGGLRYIDLSGNNLSGSIPSDLGGLANLQSLSLYSNQLSGAIPAELGDLEDLQTLMLFQNQLSGPIPAELGGLTNLFILHLGDNRLSGAIPAALSGLVSAQQIILNSNWLTGPIPAELGGLVNLAYLYLNGNQLSGPIPPSMTGMVGLEAGGLNLGYNALYAGEPALVAFLNSKDPDWASTQTVAPTETTATALDGARILVSWLPISYTADAGSYRILNSLDPGGPYSEIGQTENKSASSAEIAGLTPGETYYFVVRAHTDAHTYNPNAVESEDSSEAWAVAWTKLNVRIAGVVTVGAVPLPGVVMAGLTGNPITDSNGAYDVTLAAGWSGTVTPTLTGYTFDPVFRAYSVLMDDQLGHDYAATPPTYTISGTVTVGSTGLAGVTMSGLPGNPVTDASGDYSGTVTHGWSGTVTPAHTYYTFDPVSQTYANVTSNTTGQDYAASLITTPQRQALIALYDSTNGGSWYNNSGWKTEPLYPDGFALPGTEGTWFGLTVDTETLAVTEINLVGNGLTGTLPSALANLTQLHGLYIGDNFMSGSIPSELGTITTLNHLHLYNDQLTGSIPPELGNLVNLQSLALYTNQLTGSIPPELGSLSDLVQLRLNENQLSGSIPPELGSLTNLANLSLFWNALSGPIPTELANLTNLQILVLSHNQLTGTIPPGFGSLVNLVNLGLDGNHFSGTIPEGLGSLVNLMILGLGSNQLSGAIPSGLGNLTQLVELHLNGNQLAGLIPTSFMNLTALTPHALVTDLGHNAVYATDPDLITFLNLKDADWAATQTIAPTQVTASAMEGANILVSWLPIPYTADAGSYRVYISQTSGSGYTLAGQTDDKADSSVQVNGLTPGVTYYFVVQTHTDVHANNQNTVDSENSSEASATAWMQLAVNISGTITAGGSPLEGVVMSGLTGGPVTNALGVYTGTEAAGWSGTVTPALAGYTFAPVSRTYATVMTNLTGQDYAATPVSVPTITVTSPNGGESWALGSTNAVTWTQTALTGSVTIDLYKGGVFQKTLGTAVATAGTFSWPIALSETPGADYRVLVWQGSVSDDSDGDFIVRRVKVDFNGDGEEDILWRYQGAGAFQGVNCVWLMNQTEGLLSAAQQEAGTADLMKMVAPGLAYETPMGAGDPQILRSIKSSLSPMRIKDLPILSQRSAKSSPMEADRERTQRTQEGPFLSIPAMRDMEMARAAADGEIGIASLTAVGYLYPYAVIDLGWEIAGAGDFNGDGNTDILWRNYSVGEYTGYNCIWYMNGAGGASGYSYPDRVMDLDWRIAGTGDFDGNGYADILWRNYGAGDFRGYNCIWYMNGAGVSGYSYPDRIWDLEWEIVGTGDFNRDGNTDILWRNTGVGDYSGINCIWYMSGGGVSGYGYPDRLMDLDWEIVGTGDFNKDGYADILWRYYGGGDLQGWNCVWYMQGDEMIGVDYPTRVPDTSWRIVNR